MNGFKNWIKKNWFALLAFLSSITAIIFGCNRRRDRVLRDAKNRAKQSGQQFAEHSNTIQESRDENTKLGCDIEGSIKQTEGIREDNQSISEAVDGARQQLSNIESSIDARINELKQSKKN